MIPEYRITAVNETAIKYERITNSESIVEFVRQLWGIDLEVYESCFIIMLSRDLTPKGWAKISQGGIVGTVVDPMLICKYAVSTLSKNILICHNHPSGNTKPSEQDKNITKKVKTALEALDCKLIDHIIITKDSYYSFLDNKLL